MRHGCQGLIWFPGLISMRPRATRKTGPHRTLEPAPYPQAFADRSNEERAPGFKGAGSIQGTKLSELLGWTSLSTSTVTASGPIVDFRANLFHVKHL